MFRAMFLSIIKEHITVTTASGTVAAADFAYTTPASSNNTRSCSYSDMLLMMDENMARNMYSLLEINKSK